MMSVTNKRLYPKTQDEANRIAEEYRFLGFSVSVDTDNVVTVYTIPPKAAKPKKEQRRGRKDLDSARSD